MERDKDVEVVHKRLWASGKKISYQVVEDVMNELDEYVYEQYEEKLDHDELIRFAMEEAAFDEKVPELTAEQWEAANEVFYKYLVHKGIAVEEEE